MKNLYLLAGVSFVLIAVTTVVEGVYLKDRWSEPGALAEELGKRFENVDKKVGRWTGIDTPVEEEVQERAGAVRFVSRRYTHEATQQSVDVWLIVGHARDIIRHTPDICYPASGFHPQSTTLRHTVEYDDKSGDFFTGQYQKEDSLNRVALRVFWAWNHPKIRKWEAPDKARHYYGMSTKSLYKLYFTSAVSSDEKTADDNAAADFAEIMLPEIDAALFPEENEASESNEAEASEAESSPSDEDETDDSAAEAEDKLDI